jgi:hypothetical protein
VRVTQILGILGIVGLTGGTRPAAAQPTVTLSKPQAETSESFTRVSAIRELPSGKVLVADQQDKVVQLVDLASGSMSKVGREGQGPGEYGLPGALLPLPNGETLLYDLLGRRFLIISPEGKPGSIVEMPRPTAGTQGGPVLAFGFNDVRGADGKGRVYFQGSPFSATGATADSVAIMRWDRVQPKFDTIGFVKLPAGSAVSNRSGGNVTVRIGGGKVWMPTETWDVAGDGRVARLSPAPYRVIWLEAASKAVAGPVQAYTPRRVTEADKELFKENQKKNRPTMIMIGGGGGNRTGPPPGGQLPEPEFEETMPPFTGRGSVLATPEGEVWVLRTRPASDKVPSYDVFDRSGALVKKVTLNPDSRVVGFGKGTVYVVRTDSDDLQYLQRYSRP